MWHDMWGWGGMWFGWIFWLVTISLIVCDVKTLASTNRSQSLNSLAEPALRLIGHRLLDRWPFLTQKYQNCQYTLLHKCALAISLRTRPFGAPF
ncbi:hypothetical protein IIA28_18220 [candidate division KSB1 bacterium]|nr:hypothetical protein [candidate division KSB1 bacterium]